MRDSTLAISTLDFPKIAKIDVLLMPILALTMQIPNIHFIALILMYAQTTAEFTRGGACQKRGSVSVIAILFFAYY